MQLTRAHCRARLLQSGLEITKHVTGWNHTTKSIHRLLIESLSFASVGCFGTHIDLSHGWVIIPVHYSGSSMDDQPPLNAKLAELETLCAQLIQQHQALELEQQRWRQERKQLLDKNLVVKGKLEAMINRLRSLEQA